MNTTINFEVGKAYIVETPGAVHVAYVCELMNEGYNFPEGLYMFIKKNSNKVKLKYDRLPMNINWDKSHETSVAQAKATMILHKRDLSFFVGGMYSLTFKMTKEVIYQLNAFYQV
jgi:hypothetical protein